MSGCDLEGYDFFFQKKIPEHSDSHIENHFQLKFFTEVAKYQLPEFALLKKIIGPGKIYSLQNYAEK